MNVSVVVTTYNRPDALAAVLEGYLAQSDRNFDLLVADDGSTEDTRKLIAQYRVRAPFEIRHVWHEDQGFRAAAIRNRALAQTQAHYVIFTDGDCVPCPDFVAQHRRLAERGWFVAGNRLLLSESFTRRVLQERIPIHRWGWQNWARARAARDINRLLPLLRLPCGAPFRKWRPRRWEGIKTCNLSAWRSDLLAVNGLDETYTGWGLEDSDLVIRLLRAGVKHKSARFAAPLFHLWHQERDRSHLAENQKRLEEILRSDRITALQGVNRYLVS